MMRRIGSYIAVAILALSLVPFPALGATTLARADHSATDATIEKPSSPYPRHRVVHTKAAPLAAPASLGQVSSASTGSVVRDGADWLRGQQDAAGWFPWTPGGGATTNTQGPSARGLLKAYEATGDGAYLDAAVANGDYLVPNYPRSYTDGDPRFATHDPLFLEELSQETGDAAYSDFVQTYFWDKLAGGTYGESNDMDAAAFGDSVVDGRASQGYVALSPWDLSATAIAAHLAGETAIRDALMSKVLRGLEETVDQPSDFDVAGLTGAVWASAVTGVDLNPTAGVYASDDSTADLGATLAGMQLTGSGPSSGGWPYETRGPVPEFTNDGAVWKVAFGNSFETTLTKQFTNVTDPTISFDMRLNIEEDWDYGQVLVSTDGVNFVPLAGSYTTTDDPNGNNPGHGITGYVTGDAQVTESMTIPGFASGSDYWVRFRFIADAASSGNGASSLTFNWEIDNITVDGSTDDATSENGWTVQRVATDKASTQNTAFGALALHALDPISYIANIASAVDLMRGLQQASGQILNNPTAAPTASGSVEVHAEALASLVTVETIEVDPSATSSQIQDLINGAPSGTTIVLPAANIAVSGGFTIGNPGITVRLSDGTVVQASSPCFTVSADDTTIESSDLGVCEPSDGDHGILTSQAVDNLVIKGVEIRHGSGTGDGIHIGHDVSNLQILDSFIHDMGGDGIEYASGVTIGGVHEVQGNLFQNNSGNGVNNVDGPEYNVEFNAWGHYDGPGSGDGVSGALDYDPWTHVALSLSSSGSPKVDQVAEGYQITYTVQLDAQEVWGSDFDLNFDATKLEVISIDDGGLFAHPGACDIDSVSDANADGALSFCGQRTSAALSAAAQQVYTVTFEAKDGSGGSTVALDLDETDDAFGTAPPGGGSNNVYASALDDGTVDVYNATTVTGRIDLQGRADDTGAAMAFEVGADRGYGPYAFAASDYWGSISADGVVYTDTYPITVDMDRYLNVIITSSKSASITEDDQVLNTLVLLGGDANGDDAIDVSDASIIGGQYGNSGTGITDERADINDDDVIDILDLVLMGGNYGKTSDTAYASWTP